MSAGAPQRNANGTHHPMPKDPIDPEEIPHITEPGPQPHSNPLSPATPNGSVMWAGPDPTGAGARSAGPEASHMPGGGGASAVTAGVAASLPHRAGAGLAPPPPRPAVTPVHAASSLPTRIGIVAANDSEAHNAHEGTLARLEEHILERLSEQDVFAIVKTARQWLTDNDAKRRARKDTNASAATIADYQKKCRFIEAELEAIDPGSPAPLFEVMLRYADRKQTFQALKSALRWQTLEKLQTILREQDRLQRAGQRGAPWKRLVLQLNPILHRLKSIDALNREECLAWIDRPAKPSKSKRRILHRLSEDWRQRFLDINATSETYRHAGVLLVHCGLRPTELASGVRVRYGPKGVRVLIAGAKVRDTAGQPWRTFLLDPAQLPAWFVQDLKLQRRMVVQVDQDPLRAHLNRMSQVVLNPRDHKTKRDLRLSAYVFRHALVTDLREGDWDTDKIAACIGESAEETLKHYGMRRHSGSRQVKPKVAMVMSSVRVPREVKPRDTGGLKAIRAKETGNTAGNKAGKKAGGLTLAPRP